MMTVAVRELRNNTADVVRRAREGETVVLTSHSEPVARVVPLPAGVRPYLTPADVVALPKADAGLRRDLAALADGDTTDDLGPIR